MKHHRLLPVVVAAALGASISSASIAESSRRAQSAAAPADTCPFFFRDWGDAPEGFPAYLFAFPVMGHFPTCPSVSAPGTQEFPCGTPASTPPGPTGSVQHVVGFDVGIPFWLGCGAHPSQADAGDGEPAPKTSAGSDTGACGAVAVDCFERAIGPLVFGQDECIGDEDAGVIGPLAFMACSSATIRFRASVCPNLNVTAYVNVLADWNIDGDWNDNVFCAGTQACVSEWAVKNQRVELTPGCSEHVTSSFRVGPHTGQAWMRVTLTNVPVSDDFPWAGSVGTVNGDFSGGETEDHLAFITTVVEVEPPPRSALRLAVPRPNPFRVASAIHYDLTRAGPVRLAVFDVAGRAVRVLAWTVQPGGSHTVFWDGTDEFGGLVASGVYVVRLEAEQRVLARRVVVAR